MATESYYFLEPKAKKGRWASDRQLMRYGVLRVVRTGTPWPPVYNDRTKLREACGYDCVL